MELEKNFFHIHQRILSKSCIKYFCALIFGLLLIFFICSSCLFVYTNLRFRNTNKLLEPYYKELPKKLNKTLKSDLVINIIVAENNSGIITYDYEGEYHNYLSCVGDMNILRLHKNTRNEHNFHNITIILNPSLFSIKNSFEDFLLKQIIGYRTILINQIISTFNFREIFIMDHDSREHWLFWEEKMRDLNWEIEPGQAFLTRLLGIFKIILGLFLASNISAIYFLIIIIAAPMIILASVELISRCLPNENLHQFQFSLMKIFPWLGIYVHTIILNQKSQIHWLFLAMIGLLIIFYCIFVSSFYFLNSLLFVRSFPLGIDLNFYILIIALEVSSFLFMRTRTSLKYCPKLLFVFLLIFCCYIQFNKFAFYKVAYFTLLFGCLSTIFGFIIFLEIPALTWNPSFHYTPSAEKPRALYMPLFSMSWYYDLPHLWTLFYPLHDRSTFTENEMSLIDRKYVVLNNLLNNPNSRSNNETNILDEEDNNSLNQNLLHQF